MNEYGRLLSKKWLTSWIIWTQMWGCWNHFHLSPYVDSAPFAMQCLALLPCTHVCESPFPLCFCNFTEALVPTLGLQLVGPYDVISGKFRKHKGKNKPCYVLHWRYFYDPPEFQTVMMKSDSTLHHLGYYRWDFRPSPYWWSDIFTLCVCALSYKPLGLLIENPRSSMSSRMSFLGRSSLLTVLTWSALICVRMPMLFNWLLHLLQ